MSSGRGPGAVPPFRLSAKYLDKQRLADDIRRHGERVAGWCEQLGFEGGLSPLEVSLLKQAASVHDIGKLDPSLFPLMSPPRALAPEDVEMVRTHVACGVAYLRKVSTDEPSVQRVLRLVEEHHERWDGTGYPHRRPAAEQDPLSAVLVMADAVDAMYYGRVYAPPMAPAAITAEIQAHSGTQFSPDVVAWACRVIEAGRLGSRHHG